MVGALTRNAALKLLALLLAFAVWVAMSGESSIVQDLRVPVDLAVPDGLIAAEAPPATVGVRLRGPESLLRRLDPLPLEVRVDLRDAAPGPRNVQLSADDVGGVPRGIEVATIEPDRFRIELERRARKLVPIVPSFAGHPLPGYAVYDVRIAPDSLEVEGPESRVATLTRLRTDPIRLDDRNAPFTVRTSAVPSNAEVRVVDPQPLEAQVEVDVAPAARVYPGVPVRVVGLEFDGVPSPAYVDVTLSGPPALLAEIRGDQIRAVADAHGLAPRAEPHSVRLRIELLGLAEPDRARVTVKSLSRPRVAVALTHRRISR